MRVLNFNFDKLSCERTSDNLEGIKVETKIDVKDINLLETNIKDVENKVIKASFTYLINYNPDFAKVDISGEVFISDEKGKIDEIIKDWENNKQMSETFRVFLFNVILRKSNLKALQLEDDLNIPIHMPFPSLKEKE